MPAPFAALEARVNAGALAKLANVTATVGGVPVDAIFNANYAVALDFAVGTKPMIECAETSVPGVVAGSAVVVNAVDYTVTEVQPDGTGMVVLLLEKV